MLNNSSTAELSFNVARNVGEGEISVICTKNPATTTTSFIITHDRSNSEVDLTIDLYDMSGRQLWNTVRTAVPTEGTVTVDWDLKIGGGCRLRTGVYIYRIQLSGNGGTSASCAVVMLFVLHCFLTPASAQDDKTVMFNPVEHAVVSQTIAPDARGAGMGDVGVATDPDVNSQYWNPAKYPFCISRSGIALNYILLVIIGLATTLPSLVRFAISPLVRCLLMMVCL